MLLYKTSQVTFKQKIYYNNKPIILTNTAPTDAEARTYAQLDGKTANQFKQALALLEKNEYNGVMIIGDKTQLEKEMLWSFYPLHSAGGVVRNERDEILMIFRRGKWDLPKGKQDEGEDIETCALREVREETGIKQVKIEEKICNTLHIYPMSGQMILKHTAWFKMRASAQELLYPQEEEQIEKALWVKSQDLAPLLVDSFETIKEVLIDAGVLNRSIY